LCDDPVVWFNRDAKGRFLLNVAMPSVGSEPRLAMQDNFWMETGDSVSALVCPPSGKLLSVEYANGDKIRIEFFNVADSEALSKRYRNAEGARRDLEAQGDFPLTAVEMQMRIVDPQHGPVLDFDAQETRIGPSTIRGFYTRGAGVALRLQ
jgi:hypothetical protein